jgi:hypothetical protein
LHCQALCGRVQLSSIAHANIKELKRNAIECRRDAPPPIPTKFEASEVSKADLSIVVKWFAERRDGRVFLPKLLFEGTQSIGAEKLKKEWIDQTHLFQLQPWTPIQYDRKSPVPAIDAAATSAGALKKISVSTGTPAPDCLQKLKPDQDTENCEGFETIIFYLDKNGAIVAIAVAAYG